MTTLLVNADRYTMTTQKIMVSSLSSIQYTTRNLQFLHQEAAVI